MFRTFVIMLVAVPALAVLGQRPIEDLFPPPRDADRSGPRKMPVVDPLGVRDESYGHEVQLRAHPAPQPSEHRRGAVRRRSRARVVVEDHYEPVSSAELQQVRQVEQLRMRVRESSEDERQGLVSELTQLLEQIFDNDMARREEQLSKIESRVRKLRERLDKQKAAKQRLIQLHVEQVTLEAEGIRFPISLGEGHFRPQLPPPGIAVKPLTVPRPDVPVIEDLAPALAIPDETTPEIE